LRKWNEGVGRKMWRTGTPRYAWQRKKGAAILQPRALVCFFPYLSKLCFRVAQLVSISGFFEAPSCPCVAGMGAPNAEV
jgi:hypothetical protein